MSTEIVSIQANSARRYFMLACFACLGAILVWLGFTSQAAGPVWQFGFLILGAGIFVLFPRLMRATAVSLVFTEDGISDSQGRVLAPLENIDRVERGAFAFKPSNGFMVHLKEPMERGWEPGIWWRIGKRIGVGGVIPAGQSKLMADIITAKLQGKDLL